jgi:prepilin-type processing-associated H-X9-DG protein
MAGMMMPGETAMVNESYQSPPTSNHTGGVNLLLGDGSVHFVKNSVALNVWRALGTRQTAVRSSVPPTIEPGRLTAVLTAVASRAGRSPLAIARAQLTAGAVPW